MPTSAKAESTFDVYVGNQMNYAATDWKYYTASSWSDIDPNICVDGGLNVEVDLNNHLYAKGVRVVLIDPPFLGSKSETGYFITCYEKDDGEIRWITLEMTIALSDCHVWICSTSFEYKVLEKSGDIYVKFVVLTPWELQIEAYNN
jgi:hypothetical protein